MHIKSAPSDPALLAMLEKVKHYIMSPGERAAQRKSWVIGEMMLERPEMSREEAEAIYERVVNA